MNNIDIIRGALMCATWIVLLIADLFLLRIVIKQKKTMDMRFKQQLQELEDISKQHCISIETNVDDKSEEFKHLVAIIEAVKVGFSGSTLFMSPDYAEILVDEGSNESHREIAIGSFGEVNGVFFQVVGGRNEMYISKKIELENKKKNE